MSDRQVPDFSAMSFSTEAFSERDRKEVFCEIVGRSILKIEADPLPDQPLVADFTFRALPGLGFASARLSPIYCRHVTALADNDDPVLVVASSGGCHVRQEGHDTMIREGQATLTANGVRGAIESITPGSGVYLNFRLSRDLLTPNIADLSTALARPISENSQALRLLLGYSRILDDMDALSSPELRSAVVTHIHDLAALAIGASVDGVEIARRRGVAAARLHAIKTNIEQRLGDHELSVSTVAARHGVTPRYVHRLFELEGVTFSEFVLARRLDRANRMLRDARFAARTISAIAFECGFADLSYFNRTFRRLYRATPSDIREASWRAR
jgi:AraC-like DNA-binding protein